MSISVGLFGLGFALFNCCSIEGTGYFTGVMQGLGSYKAKPTSLEK